MLSLFRLLSLRYLRQRWSRAILIVVSIALGVASWVTTTALGTSLEKAIHEAAAPMAGAADLHVRNGDSGVPAKFADRLRGIPGVDTVRAWVYEQVKVGPRDQKDRAAEWQSATLLGVDVDASGTAYPTEWAVRVSPDSFADAYRGLMIRRKLFGTTSLSPQPAVIGLKLDRLFHEKEQLAVLINSKLHPIQRVGVIEATGPASMIGGHYVVMDCDSAAELAGHPGIVSRLDLSLKPDAQREVVRQLVKTELANLGSQAKVYDAESQHKSIDDLLAGPKVGFFLCGAGALVVGMFLVYNSMAVSVAERSHDIGIMRSVGSTKGQIWRLFMGEAAVLGLAGTVVGVPSGLGLAQGLLGPMRQLLGDVFLPLLADNVELNLGSISTAILAGMAVSLLAAIIPASRAASQAPAAVVRRIPPSSGWRGRLLLLSGSIMLAGLGLALIALKTYLPARVGSFAGVTLVLLALLPAIPLLISVTAGLLQPLARRLFRIEGRLAADNLVRAPGRTGLVIGALAAGVALMFQTAGMLRSTNDAFLIWIDRSITADLIVTSGGPLNANAQTVTMDDKVLDQLQPHSPGLRVMPVSLKFQDWKSPRGDAMILVALIEAETYYKINKDRHPNTPQLHLFQRLYKEPNTIIVSENFAARYGVGVGDRITLPGDSPQTLEIIGTLADYSWNLGTILMHRTEANLRRYGAWQSGRGQADALDVYVPEGTEEAVRRDIVQSSWGAEQALFVMTKQELRGHVEKTINSVYRILYAQQFVIGLVVALGVVAALLISVLQRRRELGILRAIGATRGQVLRSVIAEAVLMGAIGTLLGFVIGLPLEWYFVRVILFEETQFVFPLKFPWWEAGVIAGLAMTLATGAGLWPALQAVRMRIPQAIAYE